MHGHDDRYYRMIQELSSMIVRGMHFKLRAFTYAWMEWKDLHVPLILSSISFRERGISHFPR